jgi:hypothetical protein
MRQAPHNAARRDRIRHNGAFSDFQNDMRGIDAVLVHQLLHLAGQPAILEAAYRQINADMDV